MLLLLSIALLLVSGAMAVCGQSALDAFNPNANGTVYAVVVQPDGKILVGGSFTTLSPNGGTTVTRNRIARLNPDGTLDTVFHPNANDIVYSIAVQPDGKILAGGQFTSIGGQTRSRIARLDATTGLPDSFNPNVNGGSPFGSVRSIAVQADGKILAGGDFHDIGGQTRNYIARLDATTGLADSFNPNANSVVNSIVVQTDGKILVGGALFIIGGQTRNRIARLDPITGLPDSFDPNANSEVYSIAVQADGKVLAGGQFATIGGQTRGHIARLDATTGLADSFNPNANGDFGVLSVAVQADGKILAGGDFTTIGGQTRNYIARLDPTTGLADSFKPNANSYVWSIAVQAGDKVLAGGQFTSIDGQTRNRIARLETDGQLDQTINPSAVGQFGSHVLATAVQPDGKILIGGIFDTVLGVARNDIARFNTDGTLDTAFNPNLNASSIVRTIAVQADGKILVGGGFTSIGGQTRSRIARLDGTTGLADSFNPNADADPLSIEVQADGKILVAGSFTSIGGQMRNRIARLDATTGLADSFDPNATNGNVNSIAVQADGKILAGGVFTGIGGQTRNGIARLDAMTGLADSFDPNANNTVISITVQADGQILVGGQFTSIGGQIRNNIARLDATTGLADSFNPNANGPVVSVAVQADGKILAGGVFTGIGGQTRHGIARLDATTGVADSFDANLPNVMDAVYSIAVQADGKILVGGIFTSIGGQPRSNFARLSNDTAALHNLAVTQTTVVWTRGGASPQFRRVTFENSTDNVNYAPLANGTQAGNNWILTGLSLPTGMNFYIRARGYYCTGFENGSESITESVRNAFVAEPTGTPTPTPTQTATPTPTPTQTPTPTLTPAPAPQAINLSTRMRVQTGDNVGIGGFIITGTAPKHVLLRAIGPSLTPSGVPDALADPVLELHGPDAFATITNNNWRDTQEATIIATGIPPTHILESAIDATLAPGAYTAIVRGNDNSSGVALVEVYDLNQSAASKLANISTRAFVSTGDNIVIAGFVLGNNMGNDRVVVRGIGPSLTAVGVPNALADPTLELRDGNGALIMVNNDWQENPAQATELIAAGLAPTDQLESGISATLPAGPYTALLAGLNNGTGIGVVEVYDRGP